jgi:hypothetical protein
MASQSFQSFTASATTLNGLQHFRSTHGLATNGSQDLLTPAGDGVANPLKYAFNMIGAGTGQAPYLATPNTATLLPNGSARLPLVGTNGAGELTLTHIRRKAATNPSITYAAEFSDGLLIWSDNPAATTNTASIDDAFERVTVTDSLVGSANALLDSKSLPTDA